MQWITHGTILLSGDVERNPGPNLSTFNFCTWNLNSITAHDFTRLFQIEAYDSIYSYDLIGIVETHLDFFIYILNIKVTITKLPTTLPTNYYTTLQKRCQEEQ